jgi:hypothetical protein
MTKCIAYTKAGDVCGQPAEYVDAQRGGMVCALHRPARFEARHLSGSQPGRLTWGVYEVLDGELVTARALCYCEEDARHICALFNAEDKP